MASETGGVKPMSITGRMARERERCIGMTDEERAWRKQWVKDQILSPNEPVRVEALEREFTHPIRRFYRFPLDKLCDVLTPAMGFNKAFHVRFWTGKFLMAVTGFYMIAYYFKYNQNDWTRKGGWRVLKSRTDSLPGDPDYPRVSERMKPSDYASRGFSNSPI